MKLIQKVDADYYECICTGYYSSLMENKPLASMLNFIKQNSLQGFLSDEKFKCFANGLKNSFENDGYLSSEMLTPKGDAVIQTKKAWKVLKGMFKFSVLEKDGQIYIFDVENDYGRDIAGFNKVSTKNFLGEYINNSGMHIKNIETDPFCFVNSPKKITVECVYDYEKDANSYQINLAGRTVEFPQNDRTFKLIESYESVEMLQDVLNNYRLLANKSNLDIVVKDSDEGNILLNNALASVFKKGYFDADKDNYRIEEIRLTVKDGRVAENLLLRYLMEKAEERYCGLGEMTTLIADFYKLFKQCVDIPSRTHEIYEKLLEKASNDNRTAYLRLRAYDDLTPDTMFENYKVKSYDFSNREMSINDIVKEIVGNTNDIESVDMLTKYAYKNAAISRAINLFADALKRNYNIPLHLITARDNSYMQADVAREYFEKLGMNQNIDFEERNKKEIEKIHDRYYRIKHRNGNEEWYKMTGELDALRFSNDFADGLTPRPDIDEYTVGLVKEMTVVKIERDGVMPAVTSLLED